MLNSVIIFLAKRLSFLVIPAAIILAFATDNIVMSVIGVVYGASVAIVKLYFVAGTLKSLVKKNVKSKASLYITGFLIMSFILIISVYLMTLYKKELLPGTITGIVLLPVVIIINALTEAIGITKNSFENKKKED